MDAEMKTIDEAALGNKAVAMQENFDASKARIEHDSIGQRMTLITAYRPYGLPGTFILPGFPCIRS